MTSRYNLLRHGTSDEVLEELDSEPFRDLDEARAFAMWAAERIRFADRMEDGILRAIAQIEREQEVQLAATHRIANLTHRLVISVDRLRDRVTGTEPPDGVGEFAVCPDCTRRAARTADDVVAGACPKSYAPNDPDSAADCERFSRGASGL